MFSTVGWTARLLWSMYWRW